MSLKAIGVKPGDEVIVPGLTFKATAGAVETCGATPIIVDVEEDSHLMSIDAMRAAINLKTKAIIPVHLEGAMVNMEKVFSTIKTWDDVYGHKIQVIEDAAQAFGAEENGQKAGSLGVTGCFSMYPAKLFGGFGDNGAIVTNDDELAEELRDMRNHYKGTNKGYGGNFRMDNLQAAILNVKFKYLEDILRRRKEIALLYEDGLNGLPLKRPLLLDGRVWQDYVIRTEDRDDLYAHLATQGIETMKAEYPFTVDTVKPPITVILERETLRIPCNETLTTPEIFEVIKVIRSFYE